MKILDGRKIANRILFRVKKEITAGKLKLTLGVVLVGENPASIVYINQEKKACEAAGIKFKLFKFPERITSGRLEEKIKKISQNKNISGIMVQLPLPKDIPARKILNLIPDKKDIDVLSEKSLRRFYSGELPILPPPVAAISLFLKECKTKLEGKYVGVVGAGELVGKPTTFWLLREKATISVLNKSTKNPPLFTKNEDIVILAAGSPRFLKGHMVKKGVVVIDAGISFEKGKIVGDADFKSVSKKASYITPVPGGVGPLTVACLLDNLIKYTKTIIRK